MTLTISQLSKTYHTDGKPVPALSEVSFTAGAGAFVSLVGPSGSGKSTLFNIIAGLDQPDTGEICLNGQLVSDRAGRFGYMPQRDLLLPWRTVLDNAILCAEMAGQHLKTARAEAEKLLPLFGLEGFGQLYPASLSGGMRQRAALLRTFFCPHEVLLLDEPFGALDAMTRHDMQQWLLDIWRRFDKTILFITHDLDEALLLADRVIVLSARPGRVILDLPVELPRPRTPDILTTAAFADLKRRLIILKT